MIWRKNKSAIIICIFLASMVAVYFLVIDPMVTEIGNKKNKIQEDATLQENQRSRLNDLPKLKKDFETAGEAEGKIKPFLNKDKAVEFIQEVEKLAEDTGNVVAIEILPTDTPVKGAAKGTTETVIGALPSKDYLQLKIKTTGSFFGLLKFLNKLENSSYYLDVVSLQSSRNPDQENIETQDASTKNPFGISAGSKKVIGSGDESKEVVSLIGVAVYTQK